jgi:lycopene beta-cyclase
VRFPNHRRSLCAGYFSIASDQFRDVLMRELGDRVRLGARVEALRPNGVTLAGGEEIAADAVIDGRGFRPSPAMAIRFQTFLGRELRFAAPHGLSAPIIMDATTPQEGGYRFTYVLPFSAETALVEDTAYEDAGRIDRAALSRRIDDYCGARGWRPVETLREEAGVLPITLDGDPQRFWREQGAVPAVGLRGAFFHPVTGYSLPNAVRVAELVSAIPELRSAAIQATLQRQSERLWREQKLFRALNRMLFLAGTPDERWRVMERFYRLPENLISRFYAARQT